MRPLVRLTLATKFSAVIAGVLVLAGLSSLLGLLSTWNVGGLMQTAITENLPSVRAAEAMEIALLEQGATVSSCILDPANRVHLTQLQEKRAEFEVRLAWARATAHTPRENAVLDRLEQVYRQYDAKRGEVLSMFGRGGTAEAVAAPLDDLNGLYDRVVSLSRDFMAANEEYIDTATAAAQREILRATWTVAGCVALTFSLGGALLWLFFRSVLLPLRCMAADARMLTDHAASAAAGPDEDELRAVGAYLGALSSDVASARATVEQTRSRLLSAEKLASVGKLAASVAHELRNPLTAVKMWLFSIQKTIGPDENLDRKFQAVSEEIARMENVVRNFLEFSRPPTLKLLLHDVTLLLDNTMDLVAHPIEGKNIRVVREDARPLPRVKADADQLKQVFVNLLQNAAEAMAEGGEIHLSAGPEADADGRTMVVVRVRDTGPGMPEEVRQRIFEPFYTTKDDGTGLGLCIAARIMARHEGRLVLESSTPQGTVFAVRIPAAEVESDGQDPCR